METAGYLALLERDGVLLAAAAEAAGLDSSVPPCPKWLVGDLVRHVGSVHRWAAWIVRDRCADDPAPTMDDMPRPAPDEDVLAWYRAGHADLVRILRDADPGLQCFTFMPAPSSLAFWARRQAHETAIHRGDAESVSGAITGHPNDFALDGIDELLAGFMPRRKSFRYVDAPRTLSVRPHNAEPWLITLAPAGVHATHDAGDAEATVSGSASDLYLWLWNRPASVHVDGDRAVADLWLAARI